MRGGFGVCWSVMRGKEEKKRKEKEKEKEETDLLGGFGMGWDRKK